MTVYYSGRGTQVCPETVLKEAANIMMSYHQVGAKKEPDPRFKRVLAARRAALAAGSKRKS